MKALNFCGIAVASGFLIGILVGWNVGRTWTSGQAVLWEVSAAAGYEQFADLQYGQADADHAREALLGFADFSKSMSKLPSAQGDKALLTDTGKTYLRLAAIEELAGNGSLSHQYVLNARESFRSTGHDIPEESLRQQVAKIALLARPSSPPR